MTLRVTWVQPEDLLGHELRQAAEDGRDASAIAAAWHQAGGAPAPATAGASPAPPPPGLRALATRLLDELAALTSPLASQEPTDLPAVRAACPDWPEAVGRGAPGPPGEPGSPARRREPGDPREPTRGPGSGTAPPHPAPEHRLHAPTRPAAGTPPPGTAPEHRLDASTRPAAGTPPPGTAPPGPALEHRLHASWVGRAVGCLLGKPVEKLPLSAIRDIGRATGNWPLNTWFTAKGLPAGLARAHPWNRRSAATSLAENIDGMPEDDDLNYPLLNLLLLQRYGRGFTTADVGRLWLDELPAGRTFTAERVAYRNLLSGVEPPHTAVHHNPFREWIGAAIRADMHGWTHPGDPAAAAGQAHRDAVLTHTANGVHGAMFVAATVAAAAGGDCDVHGALAVGLGIVPPASRIAHAIRTGIDTARAEPDFDTVVDRLHTAYGHYHWVHVVPNAALLAAALTHADGDFTASVCRAVSGGWDTDSNGATAGSVAGLLAGRPDALPDRWTAPLKNRLATSVADFDGTGFDTLAHLTYQEALRP